MSTALANLSPFSFPLDLSIYIFCVKCNVWLRSEDTSNQIDGLGYEVFIFRGDCWNVRGSVVVHAEVYAQYLFAFYLLCPCVHEKGAEVLVNPFG